MYAQSLKTMSVQSCMAAIPLHKANPLHKRQDLCDFDQIITWYSEVKLSSVEDKKHTRLNLLRICCSFSPQR